MEQHKKSEPYFGEILKPLTNEMQKLLQEMGGQKKERRSTFESNDLKLFDKKSAEDTKKPEIKP